MRRKSNLIACKDGRSIQVQEYSSGEGPACLFIHGFAEGGYVWNPFIAASSSGTKRLLTIDLPGHGNSSWVAQNRYERDTLVADIIHVINCLKLSKLIIVGHSLGGNLALRVTEKMGDRIAGLVIVDTPPRPSPIARKHLLAELQKFNRPYASIDEYIAQLSVHRPLMAPEIIRYIAVNALRTDGVSGFKLKVDSGISDLLSNQDGDDLEPIARLIKCPSLVVRGGISGVVSQAAAVALADQLTQSTLKVVPGAGHSVMLDNIFGFKKSIEPFLEGIFYRIEN